MLNDSEDWRDFNRNFFGDGAEDESIRSFQEVINSIDLWLFVQNQLEDSADHDLTEIDLAHTFDPIQSTEGPTRYGNDSKLAEDYLDFIRSIPVLKNEQVANLCSEIEAGCFADARLNTLKHIPRPVMRELSWVRRRGEKAKSELTRANLRLVFNIAIRFLHQGLDIMDLVQEGNIGLLRAIEKFDHSKGFAFSTYATWWIRQSIDRAVADQGNLIRLPVHARTHYSKIIGLKRNYFDEHRQPMPMEKLLEAADLSSEALLNIERAMRPILSLDSPLEKSESTLGDLLFDLDDLGSDGYLVAQNRSLNKTLESLLDSRSERQAFVLRSRYGIESEAPMTLDGIGEALGLTRERIRQIEKNTIEELRGMENIRSFLEDYLHLEPSDQPPLETFDHDPLWRISDGRIPELHIFPITALNKKRHKIPAEELSDLPEVEKSEVGQLLVQQERAAQEGNWDLFTELETRIWELSNNQQ